MSALMRRKSVDAVVSTESGHKLARSLGWPHLIALGVGAIVGTGIYTLTGIGAERAGPAVVLAFAIAGMVCACAALAYTEMATLIPAAGSAYTYSYAVIGELIAWVVGWSLILEYSVACSAVAVGWSGYLVGILKSSGIALPEMLLAGPHAGGLVNVPAVLVTAVVTTLLVLGTRESATLNAFLVLVKLVALAAFIGLAVPAFQASNFEPFMPYGFGSHEVNGLARGVMAAAALVFFAFFGFDAVSTAAEEARNPSRDLTIGIIGSMILCTLIYMAVAGAAVGASSYLDFSKSGEPLAYILRSLGHPQVATLVAGAAVVALPTVIMVFMYGQSRIFFAMARDGLLPRSLANVHPRLGTPVVVTIATGVFVAAIAGFFPLGEIAELSNAGTLCAFIAVSACMMILRVREPGRPRIFRCPLPWVVGPLAIAGCLYLFASLPDKTIARFFIWNAVGILVYLAYGMRKSRLAMA